MQSQLNPSYNGTEELITIEIMKNYNRAIVSDAFKNNLKIDKIIDFGAGIGTLSEIIRKSYKKEPICIEIDDNNINFLRKRKFNYLKNIKEVSESVDLIFSSNVLEHIKNDQETLIEMRKYLNEKGILYLYLPANMILWTKLDVLVGHYRRYEISSLRKLCNNSGFEVIKLHYSDSLGFFITLIWKLFNKFFNKSLPSKSFLIFYDKFIFPFSRVLDKLGFKYLVGKNIVLKAKKKDY